MLTIRLKETHGTKGRLSGRLTHWSLRIGGSLSFWFRAGNTNWTPLFLVGTPRVGSHFLRTLLNSHPDVDLGPEILLLGPYYSLPSRFKGKEIIRHIQRMASLSTGRIRGFKMHFHQMDFRCIDLEMLNAAFPRAKYLLLYRQDIFEQACSEALASSLGSWIRRKASDRVYEPIRIEPKWLESKISDHHGRYEHLVKNSPWLEQCAMPVSFEALITEPQELGEELLRFLDLPGRPLRGSTLPQRDRPIREYILNYDEVSFLDTPRNNRFHFSWRAV